MSFKPPPNKATTPQENDEYWKARARNPKDPYHHRHEATKKRWAKEGARR